MHIIRVMVLGAGFGCLVAVSASAEQASDAVAPPESAPAAAAPVAQTPTTAQAADERLRDQKQQAVRATLNATIWELVLTPDGGGKKESDTLTFTDRTVTSKRLSKEGYGGSNYSVRLDGEMEVWETMQTKQGGMAFWRGDLYGDKMGGALSQQPKEGEPVNFSFSATKVKLEAPPAPAAPAAPPAQPAPSASAPEAAAAPAASDAPEPSTRKKKRWGLF